MKISHLLVGVVVLAVSMPLFAKIDYPRTETVCCDFSEIPDFEHTCTFDKVVLGPGETLVSVEVCFQLDVTGGQMVVDNDADSPAAVTLEFGANGSISSSDVTLLDENYDPVVEALSTYTGAFFNLDGNVGDVQGDYDPTGPDGAIFMGGNESTADCGLIKDEFLGDFVGPGTFDIVVDITQLANYGGVSGVEVGISPVTASGQLCITYEILPEPMTLVLLGVGGLTGLRRRR